MQSPGVHSLDSYCYHLLVDKRTWLATVWAAVLATYFIKWTPVYHYYYILNICIYHLGIIAYVVLFVYRIMETAPTLPDFALALKPDDYQLPPVHISWNDENISNG